MDFVLELLFEIILEGCIEIAGEKKVPVILRILCAVLLVIFYGGLVGIFLYEAITTKSGVMFLLTGIVALIFLLAIVHKYKEIKKNK